MDINDRIRILRNELRLSMKDFGAQISVSQSLLSLIENGKATITDRTISQICDKWNVNEEWLRTGFGLKFRAASEEDIKKIIEKLSFPEICAKSLYAFDTLAPDQQEAVLLYAKRFILTVTQSINVSPVIPEPSQEEAAARQAIAERLRQETSPASQDGSTETA